MAKIALIPGDGAGIEVAESAQRVLQKLGMRKEGYLRENKWSKGAWRDSLLYALLAQELALSPPLE